MNNIKYITIVSLILFSFSLSAQKSKIKKAEKSYDEYSYEESIRKFEGITDKSVQIKRKLAESYYKTRNYIKAEEYYNQIVNSIESTSEDIYNYASVLAVNKKYQESEKWMVKFSELEQDDSRAKLYLNNKGFYKFLLKDNAQYKIKNLDVNTQHQDFGTSYYMDKIVFASSRTKKGLIKRLWNWNELPFLDLFIAEVTNSQLTNIKPFKKSFNKKYHEGPASYSKDGNYTVFTANNYKSKSKDGIIKLQLFTSKKDGKKWEKAKPFKYNSNEYSVGHPYLTADGKKMYFASDMPGGYGGVDIYMTEMNAKGEWGIPKNLGNVINTEGNEMFPFVHEDGLLFFASDGLLGLGGLDIFVSFINEASFSAPKNLGVPVNSSFDDFAFIVNPKMKSGYFSSNREGGKGDDDIYSFKLLKEFIPDVILKGTTKDEDGNILANTNIIIYDENGNVLKEILSDKNGQFNFAVLPNSVYKLESSKEKYITTIENVDLSEAKGDVEKDLILEKQSDFTLLCNINNKEDNTPVYGVKVTYIDNKTKASKTINTQDKGGFLLKLKNDSIDYTFILEKEGYAPKTITYTNILDKKGEHKFNVSMQRIEIGEDLGKILNLNPIYFDLDKSFIRPDAKIELDKIVSIMNKYPNMVIELSSYTDCRASAIYNLKLSNRRAQASAHYIKTRISNPTRISGQGFGETKLVNDCGCESNRGKGIDCSEEQHQKNRRTEFKIIRK